MLGFFFVIVFIAQAASCLSGMLNGQEAKKDSREICGV